MNGHDGKVKDIASKMAHNSQVIFHNKPFLETFDAKVSCLAHMR